MSYLLLTSHILCILIGFYIGHRFARAAGADRPTDSAASKSVADSKRTVGDIESAVDAASETNAKLREQVQKLRELIDSRYNSGDIEHGTTDMETAK